MFNNSSLVASVASRSDNSAATPPLIELARYRVASDPILPSRLPSSGFIEREAELDAPKAIIRQLRRSPPPTPTESDSPVNEPRPESVRRQSVSSTASSSSRAPKAATFSKQITPDGSWKPPQPFEIFRAVEKKDIMFLMQVRDSAFELLLRKTGDATPLLHAMRIGKSHQDVAILLVGAFSRFINHLSDEELSSPKTKLLLKALRTNLKLAIDYGLSKSQSDLTASFLQTLIMSEGDQWVRGWAHDVSLALRQGVEGKPVHTAGAAVRRFATKQLGKADLIASLEDYVGNATGDLLMIGAWQSALEKVDGDSIPIYCFARDSRVHREFCDLLDTHRLAIKNSLDKRLRWQLRVLREVLDGKNLTYRAKIQLLTEEFDEGEGV